MMDRTNRSEPKLATIRDLLRRRAHGLAHGLQPVEALFAPASLHICGHGDHLSGTPAVVAHTQQSGDYYGCRSLGRHDDHVLGYGALLSIEPRMGIHPAACSSILSRRDPAFGDQVLEWQWRRLERKSPGRSRPPHYRNSSRLDHQIVSMGGSLARTKFGGECRNLKFEAVGNSSEKLALQATHGSFKTNERARWCTSDWRCPSL